MESKPKMESGKEEGSPDSAAGSISAKDEEIGDQNASNGSSSANPEETDELQNSESVKSDGGDSDDKAFAPNSSNSDETATDSPDEPGQSSGLPPSSSRLMRNLAEKMRRDKLNMYISELSSLVPIVAMATKRMDKTSVLRLSANFLRIHLSLKQDKKASTPQQTPGGLESSLSSTLLEALEGFMLIVTSSGKIVYVSESVEKLLGHSQLDLMGQSLYTICHNGDTELLRHHLQPSTDFSAVSADEGSDSGNSSTEYIPRSPSFFGGRPEDAFSGLAAGERRSFYVRLSERSMARGDPTRHVTVHLNGILRPPTSKKDVPKASKGKKDSSASSVTSGTGDEHLLVCVARPFRNKGITELSLMEAVQDEYVTRHLPDGRIIYSDHRIAFVAGYLTEEVMGLSAFNFIHQEDLPWATVANRQMFSSVEGQGYSVYRLRSKTGSLIHLRTRGFLEFNKTTQKVETFVCINTLLTNDEGDKELEKERERIMPFITFQQVTTTSTSTNSGSGDGGSSTQSQTTSEEGISLLTLEPGVSSSSIKSISDRRVSRSSPSTVMTTVVSAAIDMALLPGAMGLCRPSSQTSCIVEVPPDEMEDLRSESPVETKVVKTELSPAEEEILSPESSYSPHIRQSNGLAESLVVNMISSPSVPQLTSPRSVGSHYSSAGDVATVLLDSDTDQIHQTLIYVAHSQPSPLIPDGGSPQPEARLTESLLMTRRSSKTPSTPGNVFPRLKRSLAEVEDLVVSSSAKRTILPTAFITYNPIHHHHHHHSPHLGAKWGTETTSTIIYDQHNNNG